MIRPCLITLLLASFAFTAWCVLARPTEVEATKNADNKRSVPESATAALDWLVRHQNDDGYWTVQNTKELCKDPESTCSYRHESPHTAPGTAGHEPGVTALAMLAFLAHGHDHTSGKAEYSKAVRRALDWLLTLQYTDNEKSDYYGSLGFTKVKARIYNHAFVLWALAELLVLTGDEKLKEPVRLGTDYVLRARSSYDGCWSWRYQYQDRIGDTSVTTSVLAALDAVKRASEAGHLSIEEERITTAFDGAQKWFKRVTWDEDGTLGYLDRADGGAVPSILTKQYPKGVPYNPRQKSPTTAAAIRAQLDAGMRANDKRLKKSIKFLVEHPPQWKLPSSPHLVEEPDPKLKKKMSKKNWEKLRERYLDERNAWKSSVCYYYWYHGTRAMSRVGGSKWKKWKKAQEEALIPAQSTGGCEDGSWDPVDQWGAAGGRVYSTALGALICAELGK